MKSNEAELRKRTPVYSGVVRYFPLALQEIARVSLAGNEQHHKGQPLHWDRSKSTDELDALMRHLIDAGKIDTDGQRHSAKVAWRALANLEKELEHDTIVIYEKSTKHGVKGG
jgi:mRNA-degrading endonuclease YafQ of YafQ-DinJ toxin-antitoxin module